MCFEDHPTLWWDKIVFTWEFFFFITTIYTTYSSSGADASSPLFFCVYVLSFIQWYIKIFGFKYIHITKFLCSPFVPPLVKYSCENLILLARQKEEEEGKQHLLSPYCRSGPSHTMSRLICRCYNANITSQLRRWGVDRLRNVPWAS